MRRPGLYAEIDGEDIISVVMADSCSGEQRLAAVSPVDDLIAALDIDYSAYRAEVKQLYDYPLFAEGPTVSEDALVELVTDALITAELLRELDPIAYFVAVAKLNYSLSRTDDGTASFWLYAGQELVQILEEPIHIQVRLRNIFEMTFDGMERATQEARYEKLNGVYPGLLEHNFIFRPLPLSRSYECVLSSVSELRLLELLLYFRQDKRRIARCKYCGGFFVPASGHRMSYCDRAQVGGTCGQLGPNQQRRRTRETDAVKQKYDALRKRLWARMNRYESAIPEERDGLAKMTALMYSEWSDMAAEAYTRCRRGELSAEEFFREIDTFGILDSYEAGPARNSEETVWQKRLKANMDFDPSKFYENTMFLDLSKQDPQWETISAEQQRLHDQDGGDTLKERYGKKG